MLRWRAVWHRDVPESCVGALIVRNYLRTSVESLKIKLLLNLLIPAPIKFTQVTDSEGSVIVWNCLLFSLLTIIMNISVRSVACYLEPALPRAP